MKNITKEQAKKLAIFFAAISGVCIIFILLSVAFFFAMLHQFYFVLLFSILGSISALLLAATIVFWIFFLKIKKQDENAKSECQ